MSKHIKSTDPRKAAIVAALKAKGDVTKVTNVVQTGPETFEADGLKYRNGAYGKAGRIQVTIPAAPEPKAEAKRPSGSKRKVVIQDACAADGCTNPPTDTGYCPEHEKAQKPRQATIKVTPQARAEMAAAAEAGKAHTAKLEKKAKAAKAKHTAAPIAEAVELQKRFAAMVADMPAQAAAAAVDAKRKAPKKAKAAPANNASEARAVIAGLLARGWTQAAIAGELGTSVGRVWFWAHGANCRRIEDLRKLTNAPHPAIANHGKAPKAGSLKVKVEQAARVNNRLDDPRQLVLAIADALGVSLGGRR